MRRTVPSTLSPSCSALQSAPCLTGPSHIPYLSCDGPECTQLPHGFSIFTNKPAPAQCPRPYQCGSGGRCASSRDPLHSIPDLYLPVHSSRQKPKPNYCLFPLSPSSRVRPGALSPLSCIATTSPCHWSLRTLSGLSGQASQHVTELQTLP